MTSGVGRPLRGGMGGGATDAPAGREIVGRYVGSRLTLSGGE